MWNFVYLLVLYTCSFYIPACLLYLFEDIFIGFDCNKGCDVECAEIGETCLRNAQGNTCKCLPIPVRYENWEEDECSGKILFFFCLYTFMLGSFMILSQSRSFCIL